jgi:DNA replication protein DnaC
MLLNIDRETSIAKLKSTLLHQGHFSGTSDLERTAEAQLRDYEHNIQGVKDAFNSFIYEYNAVGRNQAEIANDLARILRIRFKSNGPRRPARVILLGPPGSGRSHQAQALSERFGLVYVCSRRLLKNEINSGSKAGKEIQKAIDEG